MRRENFGSWLFVAVFVMCGVMLLQATGASADNDARDVTLTVLDDGTGGCTITVSPETAVISRGNDKKIKKVYWVNGDSPGFGELYWELRYDPGKGGGSENYFGDVNLACGESSIKVQPKPKPKIPNAEWPYMVTVYSCVDGAKGEYLCYGGPTDQVGRLIAQSTRAMNSGRVCNARNSSSWRIRSAGSPNSTARRMASIAASSSPHMAKI